MKFYLEAVYAHNVDNLLMKYPNIQEMKNISIAERDERPYHYKNKVFEIEINSEEQLKELIWRFGEIIIRPSDGLKPNEENMKELTIEIYDDFRE